MSCNNRDCQSQVDKLKKVIRELQTELARYERAYSSLIEHVNLSRATSVHTALTRQDIDDHARIRRDISRRVTYLLHDRKW